jgi:hypothetical protein
MALVLLASAAPACLLYTDPINSRPQVTIVGPTSVVHPHDRVTFTAMASDPDGEQPTLTWAAIGKPCEPRPTAADWAQAGQTGSDSSFTMTVAGHDPFCVRVVAEDGHGARTEGELYPVVPKNRAPVMTLGADPAAASYDLYSTVRLVAGPPEDLDGDAIDFQWKGSDPAGGDLGARLSACDPMHLATVRCLTMDMPGSYQITVDGTDGRADGDASSKPLALSVLEDAAPCIEATDPSADTGVVVMAVTDLPRRFEVRRVRDDGQPFPPGPHGGTTFVWFTAREGTPTPMWRSEIGYDRSTFDVSAARFDDARPGSTYRVRVEVRDPLHESMSELHKLEVACEDRAICELPAGCSRWVTWSVRFR